ncbi:MAG TPA: sialidase family protein [Actinomycetota bacterium]
MWLGLVAAVAATLLSTTAAPPTATAGAVGQEGSGGKAVAYYPGGPALKGKFARRAPDGRLFRVGVNAAEPTLGVTESGNVFYTALQSNFKIDVLRSSNDGKTWKIASPTLPNGENAHRLSVDPFIYVDATEGVNRIFNIDLTAACSYLSFSDDEGKTWTTNPLACGQPVNDHQALFAGPPATSVTIDYPNVVYYCWNDVVTTSCSKSIDGGLTWARTGTPPYPGADPGQDDLCGGLTGHGAVGPEGNVYIPRGWCGQPWLSISKDEGVTWTRVQVADNGIPDHESAVTTDSAGNVYYAWMDGRMRLPYLAISKDQGETWSKPIPIGPPGLKEGNLPSIDASAPGKVAVAYLGSENSPGGPDWPEQPSCSPTAIECPYSEEYQKTTWNGYITMSANALSKRPVFYTSTVNEKKDPLIRFTCGPGRCRATYDFIDIEIAPDGTPWAAFVDGCITICIEPGDRNIGADGLAGRLVGGPPLR